jgi:hypothetical protein
MTWFEELTGTRETSPEQVRRDLTLDGETLTSSANRRQMVCGRLETPSLSDLRQRVRAIKGGDGNVAGRKVLAVREVIASVQALHADPANAGALFQVASQFNLLEMASPGATPELGVGIYENDPTQGPACAVAAGAGTIYRNYFAPVNGQIGQSAGKQIDCLADLGRALDNTGSRLWQMRNGYALAERDGLIEISDRLRASSDSELDELRGLLRIGLQWNTQVTLPGCTHLVSQAYCSALPVAYSSHPASLWESFARLVLEAAYEATLCAAILNCAAVLNRQRAGERQVYLTLLGGGAFGNQPEWILDALRRALRLYAGWDLDVAIVSYRSSNPGVQALAEGR